MLKALVVDKMDGKPQASLNEIDEAALLILRGVSTHVQIA